MGGVVSRAQGGPGQDVVDKQAAEKRKGGVRGWQKGGKCEGGGAVRKALDTSRFRQAFP